jgi:5'-nucleotidase
MDESSKTSFRILHFNDVYEIEKSPQFAKQLLAHNTPNTLRLFSGDILNPSLASIFEKGSQFIPLFKKIQPQFSAIGNHDLDFGEEHFLNLSDKFSTKWMMSNLKRKKDDVNIGNGLEFDFYKIGNLKIGIFAIMDHNWISASTIVASEYIYEDFLVKGRELSRLLKSFGCDYVIALTHMSTESDEALLADDTNNIDLILGGHDHMYIVKRLKNKVLIKSGSNFDFFTKIDIKIFSKKVTPNLTKVLSLMSPSEGQMTIPGQDFTYLMLPENRDECKSGIFVTEGARTFLKIEFERFKITDPLDRDEDLQNHLDELLHDINNKTRAPILKLNCEFDITFAHIRRTTSKMGILVANLLRIKLQTNIVMIHGGHLRSETVYPAGSIFRIIDLFKLLPIFDFGKTFKAKGSDLKMLFEQGYKNLPKASGGFPNFSGVKLVINQSKNQLSRIEEESIFVNDSAFSNEKEYTIATTSFISTGKDGYTKFLDFVHQPQYKEIYPTHAFRDFTDLPKNEEFRTEFEFFKSVASSQTIDSLATMFSNSDNEKKYSNFNQENYDKENHSLEELVGRIDVACLQRLQMYTQAECIIVEEGEFIFTVNPRDDLNVQIVS